MFDCIVIGGGIIGCALAEQLAVRGKRVLVLDAQDLASETTAASMGHLVALGDSADQFALAGYSLELWRARRLELPAAAEYRGTGTLWLARTESERDFAKLEMARFQDLGIRANWCEAAELQDLEPALSKALIGAMRVPDDAVIYPPNAARFFAEQARRMGAQFRLHTRVRAISSGVVELVDGEQLQCRQVIVAAGVNSPQLVPSAPIVARKGHLLITTRAVPRISHQLVELGYHHSTGTHDAASVAFNAQPRATGQVLIGSSRQLGDQSKALVMPILERMLARAELFLPGLRHWPALRAWCGLRPCTPDNLPYIGAVSSMSEVYLAAGHEGLGITLATGTADLLARAICGASLPMALTPFDPQRFCTVTETTA